MMRTAVERDLVDGVPVQPAEHRCVLRLHVREEAPAAARVRGANRKTDQRSAQRRNPAIARSDGKPRAPPDAGFRFVDADGADDFLRGDGKR